MTDLRTRALRLIDEAFAGIEYPGDGDVAYDQSGRHLECSEVAAAFRGRRWQDLSIEFVRQNADALFFFSPGGYAYFLPAFMRSALLDFESADLVPGNVVVSLSPSLSQRTPRQFEQHIAGLTVPQRSAVAAFLFYLATDRAQSFPLHDPQIALDEFWSRYLSGGE